jgi:hypothetical protein
MARPARPPAEHRAVIEAAALVRAETGLTAAEPIAGIIAVRVVEALAAFLDEALDPVLSVAGELRRQTCPTPYDALATDADIDTLGLFLAERIERFRDRCGMILPVTEDAKERAAILGKVQARLADRYTRHLRK